MYQFENLNVIKSYKTNSNVTNIIIEEREYITNLVVVLKTNNFMDALFDLQKNNKAKYLIRCICGRTKWVVVVTDIFDKKSYCYVHTLMHKSSVPKYSAA
jgi:hypothetical protein